MKKGDTVAGGSRQDRIGSGKPRVSALVALAVLVAAALLLPFTRAGERGELAMHDARFRLRGPRPTGAQIVIAGIDDATMQAWGGAPQVFWGKRYADLIRAALKSGADRVGMDVIPAAEVDAFMEGIGAMSGGDAAAAASPFARPDAHLAQALVDAGGRVVLANQKSRTGEPINPNPTIAFLPETITNIGFVDLPEQNDYALRKAALYVLDRGAAHPSFPALIAARQKGLEDAESRSALLALAGGAATEAQTGSGRGAAATFWINYVGRPFPRIPAFRLATGTLSAAEKSALRNAIVLVGVTDRASKDKLYTAGGQYVDGVEVHANAIATLLDNRPLRRFSRQAEAGISLALGLAALTAFLVLPFGRGLIVTAMLAAAWCAAAAAFWTFNARDLMLPVFAPIVGIVAPWIAFHAARSVEEGRRRREIERTFGHYVSPKIRDYLLRSPEHLRPGGQRGDGSCLFLDIRGSTAYAEERDPSLVMDELNDLFGDVAPAVDQNDGLICKFTGDGLLAVFGVPFPRPDHAQAAVDAAQDVARAVRVVNRRRAEMGRVPWRIGCGVHSGLLVYGNLSAPSSLRDPGEQRSEFNVIGDTVNLASRLEGLSKRLQCEIVISAATYEQLARPPAVSGPQECIIEGRAAPVRVYEVRTSPAAAAAPDVKETQRS